MFVTFFTNSFWAAQREKFFCRRNFCGNNFNSFKNFYQDCEKKNNFQKINCTKNLSLIQLITTKKSFNVTPGLFVLCGSQEEKLIEEKPWKQGYKFLKTTMFSSFSSL